MTQVDSKALQEVAGLLLLVNIGLPLALTPYRASAYDISPTVFWIGHEALLLVLPLVSMFYLAKRFNVTPGSYGLKGLPRLTLDLVGVCAIVTITMFLAYWMPSRIGWLFLWQMLLPPDFLYSEALPKGAIRWVVGSYLALEAGFMESVLFIGIPWVLIKKHCDSDLRKTAFCVVSATVFGVCHLANQLPEVIATFFLGLVGAMWFLKLRDLRPVVIGHTLVDVSALM